MTTWTLEEDFKLLIGIIMEHCPKANTKNVTVEGRSALACHRRYVALKEANSKGQKDLVENSEGTTPRKSNTASKLGDGNTSATTTLNGTKRKASADKKGIAKKIKKEGKGKVGPDVNAWLEDVEEDDNEDTPTL